MTKESRIAEALQLYMYQWSVKHPNASTEQYNRAFKRAEKQLTEAIG